MKVTRNQIHNFYVGTARKFGWQARATLNNQTGLDCVVFATVHSQDGKLLRSDIEVAALPNHGAVLLDMAKLCEQMDIVQLEYDREELLFYFSMIPHNLVQSSGPYEIERELLNKWLAAQDQYLEYYCPKTGFAAGVNYGIAPMNDPTFFAKYSCLVQAPKVLISKQQNTVFQFLFCSSSSVVDPKHQARVICSLMNPSGELVLRWEEHATLHSQLWVDIRERLKEVGISITQESHFYFQAYCASTSFASIAFHINEEKNSFTCEHTLSPNYYYPGMKGIRKGEIIAFLEKRDLIPVS